MNWHEYFFKFAEVAALKSKDPRRQVGCVIVDANNRIISTGFNGFPKKCNESYLSWQRPDKYGCVIHAELNAILYAKQSLDDCVLYTTNAPCENCLKHIIQAGIKKVMYQSSDVVKKRASLEDFLTIRRLIKSTDTEVLLYPNNKKYIDDLRSAFESEVRHKDNENYAWKDLDNGSHYIVSKKHKNRKLSYNDISFTENVITCGKFENGFFIDYNEKDLNDIVNDLNLNIKSLYFIKI